jgi:hypothetical protein
MRLLKNWPKAKPRQGTVEKPINNGVCWEDVITVLVFQYGSNTSPERLNSSNRLNGAAKVIGKVITENTFEFDFTVYSKNVRHIINGLRTNEIPESYIEYVKQRIVRNNPLLDEEVELL